MIVIATTTGRRIDPSQYPPALGRDAKFRTGWLTNAQIWRSSGRVTPIQWHPPIRAPRPWPNTAPIRAKGRATDAASQETAITGGDVTWGSVSIAGMLP